MARADVPALVDDGSRAQSGWIHQEGLAVGNVTAFQGLRSRLWVGGDQGLATLDGARFRMLAPATDHAFDSLSAIIETAAGDLWLSGSAGIVNRPGRGVTFWVRVPA